MDPRILSRILSFENKSPKLNRLYQLHLELNRKVDELNHRPYPMFLEEATLHQLKVEKLRVRDAIDHVLEQVEQAWV